MQQPEERSMTPGASQAQRRIGAYLSLSIVLVLGYLLNSLATLSDRLTWMANLSPFHYAQLSTILVEHQITWWHLVLLSGGERSADEHDELEAR